MTILVGTDGSPGARTAVLAAAELARTSGDDLLIVTVWQELHGDFGLPLDKLVPDLRDTERDWATATLAEAKASVAAFDLSVETVPLHGAAGSEICALARERDVRMIVLASHGWGVIEGVLFGSVTSSVLAHTPCPVLVVPTPAVSQSGAELADVDESPGHRAPGDRKEQSWLL
jgi:nucleotide-binding universal stress UspA family protein